MQNLIRTSLLTCAYLDQLLFHMLILLRPDVVYSSIELVTSLMSMHAICIWIKKLTVGDFGSAQDHNISYHSRKG